MPKILIVGGGYAGFYTAWKLEKHLRRGEAEVVMVDPLPYMTYLPFLPEVAAGSIEPRHTVVSHRRHLKRTELITAKVTNIDHANKKATITPEGGESYELAYDHIVVTAGSVSRTFPIPGIAENAVGLKSVEEAIYVRDTLISNFEKAAALPKGDALRQRLLTTVVVGGGFAGIETFAELRSLASSLLKDYPGVTFEETQFHLIEAMGRIMPEVSLPTSEWVLKSLAERGANVHLDTQVTSAVDGIVETSTGESYPTGLIVWTAGVMANPEVTRGGDLPLSPADASRRWPTCASSTPTRTSSRAPGPPVTSRPFRTRPVACPTAPASRTHSTRSARPSASRRTSSPSSAARSRWTTSTRTSAPSRAWVSTTVCSSPARWPSRASSPGSRTVATTASRCPRGSASGA